jgi:single-strand DNA-binding protein
MNNVVLMGRLTRDPEIRYTASGKPVCQFTLAVQRNYKNKEGNYDADFINIVMWGSNGERLSNTVNKGQRVLINGQIQVRSYTNKDGDKRWVTEVIANKFEYIENKAANEADFEKTFGEEKTVPINYDEEIPF